MSHLAITQGQTRSVPEGHRNYLVTHQIQQSLKTFTAMFAVSSPWAELEKKAKEQALISIIDRGEGNLKRQRRHWSEM